MVAQAKLAVENLGPDVARLVDSAQRGELVLTRGGKPIAKVVPVEPLSANHLKAGYGKGTVVRMSDDFDAPLSDFDVDL